MALVEQLVVLGIVGLAMTAAMVGVATGALGLTTSSSRNEAVTLAAAQIEYVKAQPFTPAPTTYPSGASAPPGFAVTTVAEPVPDADANVQRLLITVARDGKALLTLESIKVNRP